MSTSLLARLGTAVLAVVLATTGLTTPAHAAAETGTIEGRLTSSTGEHVGNARVAVYTADSDDYVADATTEEDGTFRVGDVPAGGVKVGFEIQGLDQWAAGKRNQVDASVLTVPAGGTLTVNERLLPTGRITGRLSAPTGVPIEGSEVSAWSEDNENTVPYGYLDADGRYSIEVAPGEYAVQFRLNAFEQWAYQARDQDNARKFTVAAGQIVVVDDTLLPTGGVTGRLADAAGEPLADATVSLDADDTTMGTTTTDHNGEYTFDTVLAGDYRVAFTLPDGAVQWAYGKRSAEQAAVITVRAGQVARVDDTFGATGALAGRFTDAQGNGLANYRVEVTDDNGDPENPHSYEAETDADGNYRFDRVLAGRYVVAFVNQETWRRQYAYGKGTVTDADRITVSADRTTTVNDTLVAGATLRITARDARTGAPVTGFCAYATGPAEDGDCTTGAEVVVDDLPAGPYEVSVHSNNGGLYLYTTAQTTVTAGQTRQLSVPMRLGGAIQTTVTATGTGRPVADACLIVVAPGNGFPSEGGAGCTDDQGRVRTEALEPGRYTVFVRPSDSDLGVQWVGRAGGTGDQRAAAQLTVRAGQLASAPAVRLDPAGSITGTVTTAEGRPVDQGTVSYSAWDFGVGPSGDAELDGTGRYTLTGLGPYEWPVLFTVSDAPRQWSGGTGDRFKAQKIKVTAGGSSRYDIALKPGAVLNGSVTLESGSIEFGRLTAYNTVTGDPIGVADTEGGRYQMRVLGSQQVQIGYYMDAGDGRYLDGWYDGAADRAHAKRVSVPATGSRTLNITIR